MRRLPPNGPRMRPNPRPVADPKRHPAMSSSKARCRSWADSTLPATVRRKRRTPTGDGQRINMVTAIRARSISEMSVNERVVLFGEDIGPKGGVHAVTLGLQEKYGTARVSIRRSRRRASSAGRWAWRSRGSYRCRKSSFRKYPSPRSSSSTTAARSAGGPATASPRRSSCGWRGDSSNGGDPCTARRTRSPSSTSPAGEIAVPPMPRTRRAPAHRLARQRPGDLLRAPGHARHPWARRPIPADAFALPSARRSSRVKFATSHRHLGRHGAALRRGGRGDSRCLSI